MVSKTCLKILSWIFRAGSSLKLFPGTWDQVAFCFILNKGKLKRFPWLSRPESVFPIVYLVANILNFMYIVGFLIFFEHSVIDMCFCSFLAVCFYLSITTQLHLMLCIEEFCYFLHEFLMEDLKSSKVENHSIH